MSVARIRRHRRHDHDGGLLLVVDHEGRDGEDEVDYEVYMRPSHASAVVDLLKHYDCRQVWYLYNSNEGRPVYSIRYAHRLIGPR